jgi:hypothetical protein
MNVSLLRCLRSLLPHTTRDLRLASDTSLVIRTFTKSTYEITIPECRRCLRVMPQSTVWLPRIMHSSGWFDDNPVLDARGLRNRGPGPNPFFFDMNQYGW